MILMFMLINHFFCRTPEWSWEYISVLEVLIFRFRRHVCPIWRKMHARIAARKLGRDKTTQLLQMGTFPGILITAAGWRVVNSLASISINSPSW